jgi:hypothetical protein
MGMGNSYVLAACMLLQRQSRAALKLPLAASVCHGAEATYSNPACSANAHSPLQVLGEAPIAS